MDYEKKYKEAFELMKDCIPDEDGLVHIRPCDIFPELKESEGICRKLIAFLRQCRAVYGDGFKQFGLDIDDALAWLEKQCEQKLYVNDNAKEMFIKALERVEEQNAKGYKLTDCDKNSWWEDFKAYTSCTIEQKPWSEEDEKQARQIERIVHDDGCTQKLQTQIADWLKSLKDRVQPKQEWKQENTEELSDFENVMMHIGNSFFGQHAGLDPNDTDAIKKQANLLLELVPKQEWSEDTQQWIDAIIFDYESWYDADKDHRTTILAKINILKSLKERCTWKPSDEQMNALNYVVNLMASSERPTENDLYYNILKSLRQQLKKLREE